MLRRTAAYESGYLSKLSPLGEGTEGRSSPDKQEWPAWPEYLFDTLLAPTCGTPPLVGIHPSIIASRSSQLNLFYGVRSAQQEMVSVGSRSHNPVPQDGELQVAASVSAIRVSDHRRPKDTFPNPLVRR